MRFTIFKRFMAGALLVTMWGPILGQGRGVDLSYMDTSVRACDNFYQFANGGWLKKTEIPAAFPSWGAGAMMREKNNATLRQILESSAKDTKAASGTSEQLIGDYFATCMDEAAIESAGTKPLDPYFKQIDSLKNTDGLPALIGRLNRVPANLVFAYFVYPDFKNSSNNMAYVWQGGLSLPNSEYYTKTDDTSRTLRDKFVAHVARMFELLGDTPEKARANSQVILRFETSLAMSSKTPVELRDLNANYNKMTLAQASAMVPDFAWETYIKNMGSPKVTELNVAQPEFFKNVNRMIREVPLDEWKTYLRWQMLTAAAPYLAKKFADENFAFFRQTLSGVKEQQPRWRQCAGWTDGQLGEALGQEFVKQNFTAEAKQRMNDLISNLFAAYRERIQKLDWMSDTTKQQALVKLGSFQRKIGYPDVLRGYQGLSIDRRSFFENVYRAAEFSTVRDLQDIGQKVDKTRWGMSAPTVDAYYNPTFNEIVFPAGILQPPFFDKAADDALNYGQIGAIIGHEITHGFDDQGSQFDGEGNLKMWWTPEDRKRFDERADCVIKQFDSYEVDKGLFINGKLTLGENIADLGGVIIAYNAYKKSLEGKPRPANIDGFTPEQRFFIAFAQAWLRKSRPEAIRLLVQSDPHSVPEYRALGPLSNMPEFTEAFGCKIGDRMVRKDRCQVW